MKYFIKKNRVILAIMIYIVFLGAFFFVVNKIVVMIDTSNDDIQKQALIQEIKYKQIDNIPKMQEQFNEISLKKEKLEAMILKKEDAVKLIEKIENLAAQCKVGITIAVAEVQVDPKAKKAVPKKGEVVVKKFDEFLPGENYLKFTVDIDGSYDDVFNFFYKIENMSYYSDILSFDIKVNNEKASAISTVVNNVLDPFGGSSNNSPASSKNVNSSDSPTGDIIGNFVIAFYLK
jgi:hypothetical protein